MNEINYSIYDNPQAFVNHLNNMRKKQFYEWTFLNPMSVIDLGAGLDEDVEVDIKAGAHFKCEFMTGKFTTLIDDGGGGPLDNGINPFTLQFSDGSNDLKLSSGSVPMDLLFSPGRVLSPLITGAPANQLFVPMEWEHIYGAKGGIVVNFKNTSNFINTAHILFIGTRLLNQEIEPTN